MEKDVSTAGGPCHQRYQWSVTTPEKSRFRKLQFKNGDVCGAVYNSIYTDRLGVRLVSCVGEILVFVEKSLQSSIDLGWPIIIA